MIVLRALRPTGLFARIFLLFWTAMSVAGVVLLALEAARMQKLNQRWKGVTGDVFAFYALSAAKDHEDKQTWKAREFLADLESRAGIRAWLFDEVGREVSGHAGRVLHSQPRWKRLRMERLRERSLKSAASEFEVETTLVAHTAQGPSGRRYTLIGELPVIRYGPWRARPEIQALRLLAVLLAAGVVSFVLSRYLATPITELRAATQQLAEGDLSARTGKLLHHGDDELSHLARDFDAMAARIETLLREKEQLVNLQRRLLRDVSHELRSPLARLNVALELARDALQYEAKESAQDASTMSTAPSAVALDRIEREAARLGELINQLLMLSRLESTTQAVESTPVNLPALLRGVAADADFEARPQRRVVSLIQCDHCVTSGSPELLRSAIENVVRNAVRHTPENTTVEVALQETRPNALIIVRDYGVGVPEAELTEIFRPFYRAGEARARHDGGAGLGLAITARAIELHGGQVRAYNASDGLTVEIQLPLYQG